MESEKAIYTDLLSMTELIADAIIKRVHPIEDDLSTREANARYGTQWMNEMKRQGLAQGHRIGGKIIFSRHELDTLRESQRRYAQIIINKVHQ